MATKFGIGQPMRRSEDPRLLKGGGRYTDDVSAPGQAQAWFLRSPFAHAEIRGIDTTAAAAMPGVIGIVTIADLDADGISDLKCYAPVEESRRLGPGAAAAADPGARPGPPCRRGGGAGGGRDHRAGQGRRRGDRGRL